MRSHASKSMLVCGIYLIFLGVWCLFFPEHVLEFLGVYTTPDIFSRMCGMIFLIFSYIYIRTSLKDKGMEFFYLLTAQERLTIPIFFITFYLLGYVEWPLIIFGFFDMSLGLWTWIALKVDKKKRT
ncbi:MAG: hypothetical protein ACFFE5_13565 [Candidatus Thorarchaeota archaeon]